MKERTAYVLRRTREWVNKVRKEKVTVEFQSRERRGDPRESYRMELEATYNEKMQQLETSDLDKSEDSNQLVKFIVKRRRPKISLMI